MATAKQVIPPVTDDGDHTDSGPDSDGCARDDSHDSAYSGGGPLGDETTQTLADLLAFLRADAIAVYDALGTDEQARVDRWLREYRRDVSVDASHDIDVERLLKRAAVDQYRVACATDAIVRHGLTKDTDGCDVIRDVADEHVRLSRTRRAHLRRLGVFPVDGGGSGSG